MPKYSIEAALKADGLILVPSHPRTVLTATVLQAERMPVFKDMLPVGSGTLYHYLPVRPIDERH